MICSSLTILFLTSFFASTWMIFRAMTTFQPVCRTLLTVPPLPAPSSLIISRSSLRRSKRNSTPISNVSARSEAGLPKPPGTWASDSEGAGGFGGAESARPLTFLRFIVRALKGSGASAMVGKRSRGYGEEARDAAVRV
jgi:hypothetical protein